MSDLWLFMIRVSLPDHVLSARHVAVVTPAAGGVGTGRDPAGLAGRRPTGRTARGGAPLVGGGERDADLREAIAKGGPGVGPGPPRHPAVLDATSVLVLDPQAKVWMMPGSTPPMIGGPVTAGVTDTQAVMPKNSSPPSAVLGWGRHHLDPEGADYMIIGDACSAKHTRVTLRSGCDGLGSQSPGFKK